MKGMKNQFKKGKFYLNIGFSPYSGDEDFYLIYSCIQQTFNDQHLCQILMAGQIIKMM